MTAVVTHNDDTVEPLIFTPETIQLFWEKAKLFPTIYGHEVLNDINKFIDLFFYIDEHKQLVPKGLFWVVNPKEFTGVFYLTDIYENGDEMADAQVHYTFFDRRHHGRVPLVKKMLQFVFNKYKFQRLSAAIPNYVTPQARHFTLECGFEYEGKRRKAARYKGDWFDVNLYGILRTEAMRWDRLETPKLELLVDSH